MDIEASALAREVTGIVEGFLRDQARPHLVLIAVAEGDQWRAEFTGNVTDAEAIHALRSLLDQWEARLRVEAS